MDPDQLYRRMIENASDGVYFVDTAKRILLWNKSAVKLSGYSEHEVVGRTCGASLLHHVDDVGVDLCRQGCPLQQTLQDGKSRQMDIFLHHKSGHRVPANVRVAAVHDEQGEIIGAVEMFSDGTELQRLKSNLKEMERLSLLDPLTELPNRRYLERELEAGLEQFERYEWPFGVIFADLDNFKNINDIHGHEIGDRVLKVAADTMLNAVRGLDLIGRWAGDEFLGMVRNVNHAQLLTVTERLRWLLKNSYLDCAAGRIGISASIGATLTQKHDNTQLLLERADKLMYQAKKQGGDRVVVEE